MTVPLSRDLAAEVHRRRTFAIISHPDAGKTTLTERLLLHGGAIQKAGTVKSGRGRSHATSDWMDLERTRGISVTSSALQFEFEGHCVNLLDTPGHEDFSEDTYRTLVAADCALMLIDAAKGVEPRTVKLFEVCRDRGLPIVTVVNKMDRPAREPFDLIDEVEKVLGLTVVPVTWPIGSGPGFRGVYDVEADTVHLFERTARNATAAPVEVHGAGDPALTERIGAAAQSRLAEDLEVVKSCIPRFDHQEFLAERITPMFFASALTGFGVENLLRRFLVIAPPPGPLATLDGHIAPDAPFFSGFVYKIAANMDRQHRDRIAFLRVTSGRFERGMTVKHLRTGREVRLSHPHRFFAQERITIDEAYPGDVIGLINPGLFRVGDVLTTGPRIAVRNFPRFAPEIFARARPAEAALRKGFHKGLAQLGEEGVVQVFWPREGARDPVLGAVGELQLDVFRFRMETEYSVRVVLERLPYTRARWLARTTPRLLEMLPLVVLDESDRPVALFRSDFEIDYARERYGDLALLDKPPSEEERA